MRAFSLSLLFIASTALPAIPHDLWIGNHSLRNAAGESCCGLGDCGVLENPDKAVHVTASGYAVHGWFDIDYLGNHERDRVDETVPFGEAQPSPDGSYWRCKRLDGSRRCFFAPVPSD
jgi:hypothetical protein